MTDFQLTRLRLTPVGHEIRLGTCYVSPARFNNQQVRPCRQCCFGGAEKDATDCGASSACLAHLRKDRESVVFKRLRLKELRLKGLRARASSYPQGNGR